MKGINFGKASGNYFFTVALIFGISALLGYYFLIYVPDHEEHIHERNFRELNQISKNLKTRANSLITNAKNVISDDSALTHITFALSRFDTNSSLKKNNLLLNRLSDELNREVRKFNESLFFTELSFEYDTHNHEEVSDREIEIHTNTPRPTSVLYSDELDLSSKVKCILKECGNKLLNRANIHECIDCVNNNPTDNSCYSAGKPNFLEYKIEIEAENLLSSLLHFDQFEHFMLTTKDWVIYESHPSGSLVFEQAVDSLIKGSNQVQASHLKKIKINGKDYDTYVRPIFISKQQHWNLVGFISSDEIRTEKLSISPKLSLILFLISIIVVLSLPIIKLQFINNHEKLDTKDIIFAYFSILCIVVLSTVLSFTAFKFYEFDSNEKVKLQEFEKSITSAFTTELDSIKSFLGDFEETYLQLEDTFFNPILSDGTGPNYSHKKHIKNYPYLEDFFVLKENGLQEKKWTVKKYRTPKFNVKERDYFNKIKLKDGLVLKDHQGEDSQYFLQSIVSYNTGEQLSIITKQPKSSSKIIGLTTKLHSLYNTVMPFGYQFAVINSEGLVQYHSDPDKNLNENFYDEISDPDKVRNQISAGNLSFFSTEYHGEKSALYPSELIEGFYLIIINNNEISYGIFSRVLRIAIVAPFLIILLIFGFISLFAKFTINPVSYSFFFRPTSKRKHFLTFRNKEYNLNAVFWLSVVLFVSIIIPISIYNSSLNRELYTLDLLRKRQIVESVASKNGEVREYALKLSANLNDEQGSYLYKTHLDKRFASGNYFFGEMPSKPTVNNFLSILNTSFPIAELDYKLNNIFEARHDIYDGLKSSEVFSNATGALVLETELEGNSLIQIISRLALFVLLQILILLLIAKIFNFAIKRFFKAKIDSRNNWSYYGSEINSDKLFIVTLSLKEHFENSIDWEDKSKIDTAIKSKSIQEIVIKNFPHTLEEIDHDSIHLFLQLANLKKKVVIICKQTPLLLAKELSDITFEFDDEDFLEALANFDTYYIPLGKYDYVNSKNNALKARSRYQKILSVLSRNEQYLIYDLAEDGVINVKNHEMINALFKKGIIVPSGKQLESQYTDRDMKDTIELEHSFLKEVHEISEITDPQFFDDTLDPKNKQDLSFRNFVLDRFDSKFIESFKNSLDKKSTWSKIKVPLVIIFVGLFAFIVFTQEAYLAQIIGVLSSLLTVLGLFSKFSSSFSAVRGNKEIDTV